MFRLRAQETVYAGPSEQFAIEDTRHESVDEHSAVNFEEQSGERQYGGSKSVAENIVSAGLVLQCLKLERAGAEREYKLLKGFAVVKRTENQR